MNLLPLRYRHCWKKDYISEIIGNSQINLVYKDHDVLLGFIRNESIDKDPERGRFVGFFLNKDFCKVIKDHKSITEKEIICRLKQELSLLGIISVVYNKMPVEKSFDVAKFKLLLKVKSMGY